MCTTLMQAMGAKKQSGGDWKIEDFMPEPARRVSEADLWQKAQTVAAIYGGVQG